MSSETTQSTLREKAATTFKNVAVLTYVLGYDDLCAEDLPDPLFLDALAPVDGAAPERPPPVFPISLGRAKAERVVGFRSPSEIVVPDPWMSGRHARLHRRGAVDVLCDEGSTNGTFVNGVAITEKALADGDLIEVGHSLFCYRIMPDTSARPLLGWASIRLGPTRTRSPEVAAMTLRLERIAGTIEPVLLLGETGAGKEVAAHAVHAWSGRRGEIRAVHCGAIPEQLFESTLFGHIRGAFTGATEAREGEIALAQRGTLFLDEIATMGPACQAKLLRVLEDGLVKRLGASKSEKVDVRWVAATNVDLFAEGAAFRPDLLRRLSSHVARLPPLRERREDLGALAAHVLRGAGIERAAITAPAARRFFGGTFPGNVRDLRRLRSAAQLAGREAIDLHHLPPEEPVRPIPPRLATPGAPGVTEDRREAVAEDVERALRMTGGNVVQAARILHAHPRQVYRWIKRFSLSLDDLRRP